MGPGPGNRQGIRYMPGVNHSTVVSEKCSLGNPTEMPCIRLTYCAFWPKKPICIPPHSSP